MPEILDSVTHVASGDLWAGAEAVVLALAREQHRRRPGRVRCIVMNSGRLAHELQAAGVPTLVLDESRQGVGALVRAVRSHLRATGASIIHSHREKENLVGWLAGVGSRGISGMVTTVHGMPEPFVAANGPRRAAIELANSIVLRLGYDAIVGVSMDVANSLRRRFPPERVHCVWNGVDVPPPAATPATSLRTGPLRLLALGRLVPIKCFHRIEELSDELAARTAGRPTVTLGGEGPLYAELASRFAVRISAGDIVMPGTIRDTRSALLDADALVITSDHEGIPMVALEALALGMPVFAFAVGGIPEIAAASTSLELVAPGDIGAMASRIEAYFTANARGRRTAPPKDWPFDIHRCADAYDALYASLCRTG